MQKYVAYREFQPVVFHSLIPALAFIAVGCATDSHLKTESTFHVPRSVTTIPVDDDLSNLIKIVPVDQSENLLNGTDDDSSSSKRDPTKQVLYFSVDVTELMGRYNLGMTNPTNAQLEEKRNRIIDVLLNVSDQNHQTYMSRFFAAQLNVSAARGVVQKVLDAAGASTALVSGEVTAGLNLSNLLIGGLYDEFESIVFVNKTFQAMEKAIEAKRLQLRGDIEKKKTTPYPEYSIQQVLSDIRQYGETSSLRAGIEQLLSLAEQDLLQVQDTE